MKNRDSRFFDFINWVFKKSKNRPENYNPSIFLLNRWLSMAETSFAKIVNFTSNKWNTSYIELDYGKLYYSLFPTYNKRINYIKKQKNEKNTDDQDLQNIASLMECSVREIEMYKNTLEELNSKSN